MKLGVLVSPFAGPSFTDMLDQVAEIAELLQRILNRQKPAARIWA